MIKEEILGMLDRKPITEAVNYKNQMLSALKKARLALSDAAEFGKGISYYQKPSGVEYREDENYTEKEKVALKKYKEETSSYRSQRAAQQVDKLDYEIYDILDKIKNIIERVEKIEK